MEKKLKFPFTYDILRDFKFNDKGTLVLLMNPFPYLDTTDNVILLEKKRLFPE